MPSTRKNSLRGDKKPQPVSTESDENNDTSNDSAPMSMDDLFLRHTELLDDRFSEHTKNLDQDIDSKAHE